MGADVREAEGGDVLMLLRAASEPPAARSSAEWLALVAQCQEVVNIATAAQDAAIARLAAIEREDAEDGTVVEVSRPLGHCALDAPDLLSGVLPISHVQAQHRVTLAVGCAAGTNAATGAASGLGGLHEAMATGVLDGYRAGVVMDELHEVPADVAATVVLAIEPHLGTDPPGSLRRRCRRALASVSPDLLRQRARRAREECGLRRWADQPGVDHWDGTFPSEDAAVAWAAIDSLAHRYVADGVCPGIERARAKALTDLVAGRATVDVTLSLTVPAEHLASGGSAHTVPAALAEVTGLHPGDPSLVDADWLPRVAEAAATAVVVHQPCHRTTGALVDPVDAPERSYRPSARLAAFVRARDRRCRFPGCTVAARFCDLDHVRPWPGGPTAASNLMCLAGDITGSSSARDGASAWLRTVR